MGTLIQRRASILRATKASRGGQAVVEIADAVEQRGQGKVKRAQAEDGGDVGGVDHEWIVGDGQHGRDGIDGKEQVGELDGENDGEQRAFGGLKLTNPCGNCGVCRAAAEQPPGRIKQNQAEEPGNPFEAMQQCDAGRR